MLERLLLIILCTISFCASIEEHQAAFVQTGDELRYFVNAQQLEETHQGFTAHSHAFVKSANAVDATTGDTQALNQLKFEPVLLQFGDHAIGIPHLQKVTVQNPTASKVRFDAVSGSTVHFHCSFFEHKTVEPGGATTFDVVFLPRQEGVIDNTLFVHSSLGTFTYGVSGVGVANPYRLRPFVGARIPLNGTFLSSVELHNPHPTTLTVTEMYTSGGDLHLELPNLPGKKEGARYTWEIPPFQTKTVMQAKFLAVRERNTTAYIRIKTNLLPGSGEVGGTITISSHNASEESVKKLMLDYPNPPPTIILPFEVEVVDKPGLYTNIDMLDFGVIRNEESSRTLQLEVISTINRSIDISSVGTEPENNAVEVQFEPMTLKSVSNPRKAVVVARVTFHGSKLLGIPESERRTKGHLVVKSKGGNYKLSVPYAANVLHGRLLHDTQETSFYAGHTPPLLQNVTVRNTFSFPIVVYNVSVPRAIRNVLMVKTFPDPVTVPPNGKEVAFALRYVGGIMAPMTSFCRLYTNLSKFDLPVHIFNGKLRITLYSIEQKQFDFGMLDGGDKRSILFAVTNENPVQIPLNEFKGVMDSFTSLKLLGVEEGNETVLAKQHNLSQYNWRPGQDFNIPAKSFAVFEYIVTAPMDRAVYHSSMTFQTPYELLYYPVTFYIEEGAIVSIPEKITFTDAFPGKISSQPLQVYSTFPKDMPLLRLSTLSHDPRIFFESFDKHQPTPVIKHGEMSYLGRVFFFPIAGCMDDCYVGMPLNTNDGAWFIYGMRLPPNLPDIDAYLYSKLRRKWNVIENAGEHIVNSTVIVDSTEVKQFQIPAKGQLVWPRLMKQSAVHFPLTAVGNFTIVNLTLHNPSSLPVVVQLLPLTIYPDPESLVELFNNEFPSPLTSNIEMNETLMFTLRDTELFNLRPDSPVPRFRRQLEENLGGIQIPRFTLSLMLQPGMKVRVRVGFLPKDYELRSSLLLIRNNLTVLEPVCLYGRGARVELKVGNRLPRTVHSLLFDIQDHHLSDCENPKRLTHKLMTTLTVRRSFMARNTGEVPVTVMNMTINGFSCQNRGFRLLNCEPFRLKPNETHLLEIAFTPDFTLSWYDAALQLYLQGNGTPFSYPLAASVPKEWLEKCQNALPRPQWEPLMYYSCVTALIFLLICMIASAYLEGDRIITCALRQRQGKPRQVFDLNAPATVQNTAQAQATAAVKTDTTATSEQDEGFVAALGGWILGLFSSPDKESDLDRIMKGRNKPDEIKGGAGKTQDSTQGSGGLKHRKQQQQKQNSYSHQNLGRKNSTDESKKQKSGGKQQQQLKNRPGQVQTEEQTTGRTDEEWVMVDRPKRHGTPNQQHQTQPTTPSVEIQQQQKGRGKKKHSYDSEREAVPSGIQRSNRGTFPAGGSRSDADAEGSENGQMTIENKENRKLSDTESVGGVSRSSEEKGNVRSVKNKQHKRSHGDRNVQYNSATPYTFVKEVTTAVMTNAKQSVCGSDAESEESNIPEWDMPSDSVNYEEEFGEMAARAEGFAAEVAKEDDQFLPMDPSDRPSRGSGMILQQERPASTGSSGVQIVEPLEPVSSSSRSTSSSSLGRSGQEASDSSSPSPKEKIASVPRKRRSGANVPPPPPAYADLPPPKSSTNRDRRLPPKSPARAKRTSAANQKNSFGMGTVTPPPGLGLGLAAAAAQNPPPGTPVTPEEPKYSWGRGAAGEGVGVPRGRAGASGAASVGSGSAPGESKLTIMQQLQVERKKRLQEYRNQQKNKGEEWPGMNLLSPVTESLWDDDCEPWNLTADQDAWGSSSSGIFGSGSISPGPVGAPARASPVTLTQPKAEKAEPASPRAGNNSAGFASPLFRLDPTVPPFVSTREKAMEAQKPVEGFSPGGTPIKKRVTPPPDPGILAWSPGDEDAGGPPSPSEVLGLSGSLFSTGGGSIWDPNRPVNTDVSWTEALLASSGDSKKLLEKDQRKADKIRAGLSRRK